MRPPQPISHRTPRARGRTLHSSLLLVTALWAAQPLHAQQSPPSEPDGSAPYVLHLYARLVELPTLILIRKEKPPTLDAQQIDISLNSAPPFHPTSLRLQGDDPLSIALLLDVSEGQTELLAALRKNFSAWAARSLRPQDHVSLFAFDCNVIQTSSDVPANAATLQSGFDRALTSPLTRSQPRQPPCGKSIPFRGSLVFAMKKLGELPGRRILLVVSAGSDGKSSITWPQLSDQAGIDSVTVFTLASPRSLEFQELKDLLAFSQKSGGLIFTPRLSELPDTLERIISLLRQRYILQFPMPKDQAPVVYHVVVSAPKFDALILPSTISVPLPDPSLDHPSTDLPPPTPASNPQPAAPPNPLTP